MTPVPRFPLSIMKINLYIKNIECVKRIPYTNLVNKKLIVDEL